MIYGPGWVLEASTNGWCGTDADAEASAVALRELLESEVFFLLRPAPMSGRLQNLSVLYKQKYIDIKADIYVLQHRLNDM